MEEEEEGEGTQEDNGREDDSKFMADITSASPLQLNTEQWVVLIMKATVSIM